MADSLLRERGMRMIEREKVVKEFEHLLNAAKGDYQDFVDLTVDFGEEIDALLKEQEAVPVIQREVMHMRFWCCGSCGVAITNGDKFCRNCGHAVKWK